MSRQGLLIIDVQNGILDGQCGTRVHETMDALNATVSRIAQLLNAAREAGTPVLFVQHDDAPGEPMEPHTRGWEIRPEIAPRPGEPVIRKRACDAFFETPLESELSARNIHALVIAGCQTQFCIDTSVRRAVTLGFDVTLAGDGHMTSDFGPLSFEQVIAHHNRILNGFSAGRASARVKPLAAIEF